MITLSLSFDFADIHLGIAGTMTENDVPEFAQKLQCEFAELCESFYVEEAATRRVRRDRESSDLRYGWRQDSLMLNFTGYLWILEDLQSRQIILVVFSERKLMSEVFHEAFVCRKGNVHFVLGLRCYWTPCISCCRTPCVNSTLPGKDMSDLCSKS
ncbi:hypothetical protein RRG08_022991 [Elysia crispata]|uniref:Uncharacterized protein n=1 Tax=Elysia crispata TaxID=231223 RepID=A0AAE1AF55_9GAST|nr:hypothetical protein RRG08_022991 [Elysia crispata]